MVVARKSRPIRGRSIYMRDTDFDRGVAPKASQAISMGCLESRKRPRGRIPKPLECGLFTLRPGITLLLGSGSRKAGDAVEGGSPTIVRSGLRNHAYPGQYMQLTDIALKLLLCFLLPHNPCLVARASLRVGKRSLHKRPSRKVLSYLSVCPMSRCVFTLYARHSPRLAHPQQAGSHE